jgi:hypothetical protein
MACKNCKSKKLQHSFNGAKNHVQNNIEAQKRKLINDNIDMNTGLFNNKEKVLMTVFGWIPLIVGYITIVRFLIRLF